MSQLSNGIDAAKGSEYSDLMWRKSTLCNAGDCVEFAQIDENNVAIRDSKNLDKTPLIYTVREWATFVDDVRKGEFDI